MGVGVFVVIGSPSPSPSPSLSAALEPRYEIGRSMRVGLSWLLLIRGAGGVDSGCDNKGGRALFGCLFKVSLLWDVVCKGVFFGGGSESVAQRDDR